MTVIRPNSVSGITSITAQANEINFFRSNGTLAGLQLNGVNFNTTTGVSTFNNLDVGGVLTYQDVTNVDSVGIITARSGIDASGTSIFRGALKAQDNLELASELVHLDDNDTRIQFPSNDTIAFKTAGSERLRITSNGDVRIGGGAPTTFGSGTTVHETYNASTYTANLVTSGTHVLQMIASQTHGATSIGTRSNHNLNLCANDSTKTTITTDGKLGVALSNPTHTIEAYGTNASIAVHYTGNARGGLCALTNQRLALATTVINDDLVFGYSGNPLSSGSFVERMKIDNGTGDVLPGADNDQDLGSSSKRWANIYSADLQLSNIGTGGNEVDGSEGSWTLQEAEDTVYMINRKNGKRYKIKMEEV